MRTSAVILSFCSPTRRIPFPRAREVDTVEIISTLSTDIFWGGVVVVSLRFAEDVVQDISRSATLVHRTCVGRSRRGRRAGPMELPAAEHSGNLAIHQSTFHKTNPDNVIYNSCNVDRILLTRSS